MTASKLFGASTLLSLQDIVRPVMRPLARVEDRLNAVGGESEGVLRESSQYVLSGGGKRLRAALVFFCASIDPKGGSEPNPALQSSAAEEIAASVELIHAATLVHDDIIDRAVLRRLKPTAAVQFGEDAAVLLGDFLYARAFSMIARVGDTEITTWMAETTQAMCEGEIGQLKHRYRVELSLDEYLDFIEKKTATLISVSARSGAKLAGLSLEQQDALASFGRNIGISFQIVDDLLDIIGSEDRIGKTLHTDAGNGKMTLPMILLLGDLSPEEKKDFLAHFQSKSPDWTAIQSLIEKYKIVQRTEACADDYFQKALEAIRPLGSPVRESLEKLSRFILKRDY